MQDPAHLVLQRIFEKRAQAQLVQHKVAPGEILGRIAPRYGVSVKDIVSYNKLPSADRIRSGQVLKIPPKPAPVAPVAPKPATPAPVAPPVPKFPAKEPGAPAGYLNNNPGNLRSDGRTKWYGATGVPKAPQFLSFNTPEDGIRGMTRVLYNYGKKHNISTIPGVVSRYAPTSENDTSKYTKAVEKLYGAQPDQKIDLTDEATLQKLVPAMLEQEIGKKWLDKIGPSVVSNGVSRGVASFRPPG